MIKKCDCDFCKQNPRTREDWVEVYQENLEQLTPSKKWTPPSDFYSPEELRAMGVKCGEKSMVHRQNIIVNPSKLEIGDNTRIDGYCTISAGAGIKIGSSVHIAGYVSLMGGAGIEIGDYCSIASGSKIFSISDDVMGRGLVGPQVLEEKRYLHKGKVIMQPHSVMAINATMMPGSKLYKGCTLLPGSVYMNKVITREFCVYIGIPAVYLKDKRVEFIKLVEETEDDS